MHKFQKYHPCVTMVVLIIHVKMEVSVKNYGKIRSSSVTVASVNLLGPGVTQVKSLALVIERENQQSA